MQKLKLSEKHQAELGAKIAELESDYPLEVKFVIRNHRLDYPEGGLRIIALVCLFSQILIWVYWIQIPAFLFTLVTLLFVLLPFSANSSAFSKFLANVPMAYLFTHTIEKQQELFRCAQNAFQEYSVGATQESNGLLIYFAVSDKKFYFLPDTGLQKYLKQNSWRKVSQGIAEKLSSQPQEEKLFSAISEAIGLISQELAANLPKRTVPQKSNEISNSIIVI